MSDLVTTNQLMVVLESMQSDIKAVYEGHSALSNQITDLRTELKEDIALVDAKVMGLAKRVDHVEERLSSEIAEVRADLAEVKSDVVELKSDMAEVKADIAELKSDMAEVKADIAELKSDLADHRNNTELHSLPKKRILKKAA